MAKVASNGTCSACQAVLSSGQMLKHVATCQKRLAKVAKGGKPATAAVFTLKVQDRYQKAYWLLLEIPVQAPLSTLDAFLRATWVECCGHLSAFTIDGLQYCDDDPGGMDGEYMDTKLGKVLEVGDKFKYEYDFGSTTELVLQVLSAGRGLPGTDRVELLARNVPPDLHCRCGQPATHICAVCGDGTNPFYCAACAKKHDDDCEGGGALPVVNSPRMGVCAYTG